MSPGGLFLVALLLAGLVVGFCPNIPRNCTMTSSSVRYFGGAFSATRGTAEITINGNFSLWERAVMIIQMQGAAYNGSNGSNYGNSTGSGFGYFRNHPLSLAVGLYELNYVVDFSLDSSNDQSTLQLFFPLENNYSSFLPQQFQVISFPFCDTLLVDSVPSVAWDGTKGGVLPIVSKFVQLNVNISMDGKGFRGATADPAGIILDGSSLPNSAFATSNINGRKGEGICGYPGALSSYLFGLDHSRGAPGNAGGGGHLYGSGGGGGGNGGSGGDGRFGFRSIYSPGNPGFGGDWFQGDPQQLSLGK